jgi:uncharacterized protein
MCDASGMMRGPVNPTTAANPERSTPDCQTCGACCATFDVWLSDEETARFEASPRLSRLTVLYQRPGLSGRFLRREAGRCASLRGRLGEQCRCEIYADRPSLCRQFEAGSPECFEARRARNLE